MIFLHCHHLFHDTDTLPPFIYQNSFLPFFNPPSSAMTAAAAIRWSSDHSDVHVLAVDDSLVDRKVIERLLKITSCKVTAVESGWRALQYLGLDQEKASPDFVDGSKVDLIITDYCMPGMTGYELLKKIKGSATFREVPVVIMSSENVVARIHRCLEEGAEDFIVKPVKLSDVKRLKDYMFGENKGTDAAANNKNNNNKEEKQTFNKRKLQEMSETPPSPPPSDSPSPPPSASPSPPLSASPSPPLVVSPSTSPTPESPTSTSSSPSSSSSSSSSTPPLSPSQLDSPTMRLKVTGTDEA